VAILFWVWCYHCVSLNSWKKHHGTTRGTKGYADTGFKNQILNSESVGFQLASLEVLLDACLSFFFVLENYKGNLSFLLLLDLICDIHSLGFNDGK